VVDGHECRHAFSLAVSRFNPSEKLVVGHNRHTDETHVK
jgi:hypothetical protein